MPTIKGNIPWNKGLTKADPRVLLNVTNGGLTKRGRSAWNKGKKGKPLSAEHKMKLYIVNKNKTISERHRKLISAALKGNKHALGCARSAETRKKMSMASLQRMRDGVFRRKPTIPEKKMMLLIERNGLPYKYTGNGKFWIENRNPDFVNINGEKKLLEVDGCYWHNCPICFNNKIVFAKGLKTDNHRDLVYKKYNWEIIRVWEHELKDSKYEDSIISRLRG